MTSLAARNFQRRLCSHSCFGRARDRMWGFCILITRRTESNILYPKLAKESCLLARVAQQSDQFFFYRIVGHECSEFAVICAHCAGWSTPQLHYLVENSIGNFSFC